MKDFIKGYVIFTFAVILSVVFPWAISTFASEKEPEAVEAIAEVEEKEESYTILGDILVYDVVKEQTFTENAEDVIASMISFQLPEDAPSEALKAQAILMYTYLLEQKLSEEEAPTEELHGAMISTDYSKFPRFDLDIAPQEAFKTAVSSVFGKYIDYNGKPIVPAFCVSSGGQTVSSATAFGLDLSYLQPVSCEEDEDFITDVVLTSSEVFARIVTECEGVTLYGEPSLWFDYFESLPSGYVVKMLLGEETVLLGSEFARILNLPSANFRFSYSEEFDVFTFRVKGCGHLVGLSLNASVEMAQKNKTCEEIIEHFFAGVKISDSYYKS